MRQALGCHGGCVNPETGQPAINEGTPYATDTCPRRHLLRNPDLLPVLELHTLTEGKVGVAGLDDISEQGVRALAVISDARAVRAREEPDGQQG
jgi:hypothetical protein